MGQSSFTSGTVYINFTFSFLAIIVIKVMLLIEGTSQKFFLLCLKKLAVANDNILYFRISASLYLDICHTLTYKRLAVSSISLLFVNIFGRSLWCCHLEFDKETITFMAHSVFFRNGGK